jgi:pimeloyl-ACP methyl ester carboxylesterase
MTNTLSQTTVSKKPNIPVGLRLIQWTFPKVEALAPRFAYRWFEQLFFSPPRYPIPNQEREILEHATHFEVRVGDKTVSCYSWGSGPVVLLVHGWAGRASQFKSFIDYFTAAGYTTVAFDAPAHGRTAGKTTNLFEFKDAIFEIEKAVGSFEAIVAHSFGGGASLFAMSEGLQTKTLITIATPVLADDIIDEFATRLSASSKAKENLKQVVLEKFNRSFDEFMSTHFITQLTAEINLLVLHDEHDKEVPLRNAVRLTGAYPRAVFHKTSGLGHVRILRDATVIELCKNFIAAQMEPQKELSSVF